MTIARLISFRKLLLLKRVPPTNRIRVSLRRMRARYGKNPVKHQDRILARFRARSQDIEQRSARGCAARGESRNTNQPKNLKSWGSLSRIWT